MAGPGETPSKHDVASALLLKGTVFVHLDPRPDSVVVPKWLKKQPQLVLQVGLDMPLPIPDLRVDGAGVYGTLSFNRTACTCMVPWEAVFALAGDDGRGMVWPASMPEEIAAEVEREGRRVRAALTEPKPEDVPELPKRRRAAAPKPMLRERSVTPSGAATSPKPVVAPSATASQPKQKPRRPLPPYLRVVK